MRLKLKWRIAGAYAVLIIVLALGLDLYLQGQAQSHMMRQRREGLIASCKLVRAAIEGREGAQLVQRVKQLSHTTGARVTVIDPDGAVLADSDAEAEQMPPHDTRIEIVEARENTVGWSERPSATLGIKMLYVAEQPSPGAPVVRLAVPLTNLQETSTDLRRAILTSALLGAIIAIIAALYLASNVTRALEVLSAAALRIGQGDLSARARIPSGDEAGNLAEALNHMAESLEQTRGRLEKSAAHLQSVLAQMADGVLVVGAEGFVQLFNSAAALLLAADKDTAVGRPLGEVVLHYELQDMISRTIRLRTPVDGEIRVGEAGHRHIAIATAPVEDESGDLVGAVASLRDITQLRHLEVVRQDFVENASHELRTPVAAIRSLSETLASGAAQDPQAGPEFLQQIIDNTERLENVIEDMMTLTRLEGGHDLGQPKELNVMALLLEAVNRVSPQARDGDLTLQVDAPDNLTVWSREDSLVTAMVNLIDNAVKYTPSGGHISVLGEAAESQTRLSVTDTGPGIPEADRERVFERFYRVDRGRSREMGGTGLGLSIVKHAVESNGGRVWVESGDQGGARFVMLLPSRPAAISVEPA